MAFRLGLSIQRCYDTLFKHRPLIPAQYLAIDNPEMVSELKPWLLEDMFNDPDDPPYGPFPNYLRVFLLAIINTFNVYFQLDDK